MYSLQILQYTTKKLITLRENKILLDRRFVVHRRFVGSLPVHIIIVLKFFKHFSKLQEKI